VIVSMSEASVIFSPTGLPALLSPDVVSAANVSKCRPRTLSALSHSLAKRGLLTGLSMTTNPLTLAFGGKVDQRAERSSLY
jgi:hypothetical protein